MLKNHRIIFYLIYLLSKFINLLQSYRLSLYLITQERIPCAKLENPAEYIQSLRIT